MSARVTRSAVKKNPSLLDTVDSGKKTATKKTRTPAKKVSKKLDLSDALDKENATPNKVTRKTPAKKSTKKKTPAKSSAKKATPKRSTKKKTPNKGSAKKGSAKKASAKKASAKKGSAKKATPKESAKKATPKRSTRKKATPKSSAKKATPKGSAKKSSAKKGSAKKSTPKSGKKKSFSEKVKTLSNKIEKNAATDEDLSAMFDSSAATSEKADDEYVIVDKDGMSEDMHATDPKDRFTKEFVGKADSDAPRSSSDLAFMTVCSLFAYAVAYYLPTKIAPLLPEVPLDNTSTVATGLLCSLLFAVGFQFASSWSSSRAHAVSVYRVSFGLASVLVSAYMYTCCEQKFRTVLCTTSLGFAVFEMCHLWSLESVTGYFRILIVAMIALWSVVLDASAKNSHTVEYNTYVLLILTVGNILGATEAVHSHFTIGTYMVASLSIFIWAIQNGKIATDKTEQPIIMGALTFGPSFLSVLEQLK